MEFSDRLRMLRLELGITRGAIAQMGGMSVSNYNRYEAGVVVPTVPFLTALYRGTGVNLVWLLTGEGEMLGVGGFTELELDLLRWFRQLGEERREMYYLRIKADGIEAGLEGG